MGDCYLEVVVTGNNTANDVTETMAIKKAFGDHAFKVAISSTKSMTGHLLGGSGGIEAVATAITVAKDKIPPTINLDNTEPACDLDYVPKLSRAQRVEVALSNSFGFGGHNIDKVRFRRPVVPGDQLVMMVELLYIKRRRFGKMQARAEGELALALDSISSTSSIGLM